jgi:hypothetical protein
MLSSALKLRFGLRNAFLVDRCSSTVIEHVDNVSLGIRAAQRGSDYTATGIVNPA